MSDPLVDQPNLYLAEPAAAWHAECRALGFDPIRSARHTTASAASPTDVAVLYDHLVALNRKTHQGVMIRFDYTAGAVSGNFTLHADAELITMRPVDLTPGPEPTRTVASFVPPRSHGCSHLSTSCPSVPPRFVGDLATAAVSYR